MILHSRDNVLIISSGNLSTNPFARASARDPPPAYTPGTTARAPNSRQPSIGPASDDDEYAFLRMFDTIFLIDDSGSMAGSRWGQVEQALSVIAPICAERDEDGIDVYFLNNRKVWKHQHTAGHIIEIFQDAKPGGQTFTGTRLWQILTPYLARYQKDPTNTKPVNIIVITDGQAHDNVAETIENVAWELDEFKAPPWQVGIQFFQVGNDPEARLMLKELDDELGVGDKKNPDSRDRRRRKDGHPIRDIVDTVPFTSEAGAQLSATGIMKVSTTTICECTCQADGYRLSSGAWTAALTGSLKTFTGHSRDLSSTCLSFSARLGMHVTSSHATPSLPLSFFSIRCSLFLFSLVGVHGWVMPCTLQCYCTTSQTRWINPPLPDYDTRLRYPTTFPSRVFTAPKTRSRLLKGSILYSSVRFGSFNGATYTIVCL